MSTNALKVELIEWLTQLNDKSLLSSLMQFKKAEEKDWADDLTDEQIKSLERGLKDIKKGRVISGEALWAKYGRKA